VAVSSEISTGSGFIISEDGYIVTNYHVVDGGESLWITTHLQLEYDAQLIGYDAVNDIALLKIDETNLPYAPIGSSDQLNVGDQVAAIGNPLGELTSTLTVGYVSAKDRIVNTDGNSMNMLQTDAAINSGNSGGPLFNMNGEVVGITTAKYSGYSNSGATIEGIGFAIPIDDVFDMIEDIRDHGYVTGAYLGVSVRDVEASAIQNYGLPNGAYVAEVVKGACADKAGLKAKDIIIDIGGYSVSSVSELTRVLQKFEPGDRTVITVYRNGTEVRLSAVLDEKPQNATQEPSVQEPTQAPTQAPTEPDSGDYEQWWNEIFPPFFGWG
jgi:serine protease Do